MTKIGEKVTALIAQGLTTNEIADMCSVGRHTVAKYRKIYAADHPEAKQRKGKRAPEGLKKEVLWQSAITAQDIIRIRQKTKVGDKVCFMSLKAADVKSGSEPTNGRERVGTVVDNKNKRFCMVQLANGVEESLLWSELVMQERQSEM